MAILAKRLRVRNNATITTGPILYWMQRDMRVQDNWALQHAYAQATEQGSGMMVLFVVTHDFPYATKRHVDFLLEGLKEVAGDLDKINIPFLLRHGDAAHIINGLIAAYGIGEVVTDFNPLRIVQSGTKKVAEQIPVCLTEIDAHNIVPCWVASPKAEFAAHTFRPKVIKLLKDYTSPTPPLAAIQKNKVLPADVIDWEHEKTSLATDMSVPAVTWLTPGQSAATAQLQKFIDSNLNAYFKNRNDPNQSALSNLSPYLHFGHISAQVVYSAVMQAKDIARDSRDAFVEELVVRRELTDNYCFYNSKYDQVEGAHAWAQKTIAEHVGDTREYVYTRTQFESAKTHDALWNAMQLQMTNTGKMHGWCRMYWAKKIMEWTPDTQTAIDIALYLNDKYELDGTDPNGVVGVMWSICGVHDRAWTERSVFGKIRYMNFNGAKRKFAIQEYIDRQKTDGVSLFAD